MKNTVERNAMAGLYRVIRQGRKIKRLERGLIDLGDLFWNSQRFFSWWCFIVFLMMVLCATTSHADSLIRYTLIDSAAIRAIIGEAEGEPFQGKVAVACAIRNRGSLQGVYGKTAPRVIQNKFSQKTYLQSVQAWEISKDPESCEFIQGADHWEGDKFKRPEWSKRMTKTAHIGNQTFYRGE